MRSLRTFILVLLAVTLLSQSNTTEAYPVHNIFQNADEKIVSEYRLTILPSSKTVFVEAVIRGAQKSDIKGWVAGVSGLKTTIIASEANELRFAYPVPIPEKEQSNSLDTALDDSRFRSWGWNVFIYPMLDKPIKEVNLSINAPEGWSIATSFGINQKNFSLPHPDELLDIAIVAGNFRLTSFEAAGVPVFLAVRQEHKVSDAAFAGALKKLIEASVAYTEAVMPKRIMFGVDLLGDRKTGFPGNNVSIGSHSSMLLIDRNNSDLQDPRFWGTYAHEFSHTWIPAIFGNRSVTKKELGSMFTEGFTDYMAYRIAHAAGLHTDEQFARALAGFYLEYLDIASSVRDEADAEFLRYRQGMITAWMLDVELQRTSKGKYGFREFIRLLVKRHANTGGLTRQKLISVLKSMVGQRFVALYEQLTETKAPVDLSSFMKGTGIKIKPVYNLAEALKEIPKGGESVISFAPANRKEEDFLSCFLSK